MTKREDLVAALEKRLPSNAVPIWELEFHAWDQISQRHLVVGEEFQRLTTKEQDIALHTNAELILSVCEMLHFAAITLPNVYWEIGSGVPAYYWLPEEAIYQLARFIKDLESRDLMLVGNCSALLGIPFGDDFVPFSYKLFDAPDEIDQIAQQKLLDGLRVASCFRDCGVEIGLSTTDLADNHSTYMNPHQLERFVWPYLRSWAQFLKAAGMYSILHTDGNINTCLENIADSGIDALQAIDPTAGMSLIETRKITRQRICLCGNVDCALLVSGSPEEVYLAASELLQSCKTDGAFVLGASNAVQQEVPADNYLAIIQAWEEYGNY
jgi:uroporphyrinogen decarboxylase